MRSAVIVNASYHGVCHRLHEWKTALILILKAGFPTGTVSYSACWKALCFFLCNIFSISILAAPTGTVIENTAFANFDVGGSSASTSSNTVSITTAGTPASISLLQYQPATPALNEETLSACRSGAGGPFIPTPSNPQVPQAGSGVTVLDPATALPLSPASLYKTNEAIFIQVEDWDQNIDSASADTVEVSVTSSTGDSEDIRLTETDVNSGLFIGYIQSVDNGIVTNNCELSVGPEVVIEATYTDPNQGSDSAAAGTLVDPFGIIFDSFDGQPVDNVLVQLSDAATGLPASVYAVDGVTPFPNPIRSGDSFSVNGTLINLPQGGYWFPLIAPGSYRLDVLISPGYTAPSTESIADLQQLATAPFALDNQASFGVDFIVPAGPPIHVDIPIDPISSDLVVQKSVLTSDVAIGDFVQYRVVVENINPLSVAPRTRVFDKLPQGFRYQSGSARLDGVAINDPLVSNDGQLLEFAVNNLTSGQSISLSYITEVTAGTPLGEAVNSAYARDDRGEISNTAQALVEVRDELMRERNILVGRVIAGNCPLIEEKAGYAALRMQSKREKNEFNYSLQLSLRGVELDDYRVRIELPDALAYVKDSSLLDGFTLPDPHQNGNAIEYKFNREQLASNSQWQGQLQFRAVLDETRYGRFTTKAQAYLATSDGKRHATPVASNILLRKAPIVEQRRFAYWPAYRSGGVSLETSEQQQLQRIIELVSDNTDVDVLKVSIHGHSRSRFDAEYERAKARAGFLVPFFQSAFQLAANQVEVNSTVDTGGNIYADVNANRRIDIAIDTKPTVDKPAFDKIILEDSESLGIKIEKDLTLRETATVGTGLAGLAGIRIYLEDGTYVVTDEEGKYHIEGVRSGTHVVQLDTASLPPGTRVVQCEKNTRFAGVPYSRFIDLQPGSLWRADFYVEEAPPVTSQAQLQMHTRIDGTSLHYKVDNIGGELPIRNYRLMVALPEHSRYAVGSSRLADKAIDDPRVQGNLLIYKLGDMPANWNLALTFSAKIEANFEGRLVTKAVGLLDNGDKKNIRIPPAETVAILGGSIYQPYRYVLQPHFGTLGVELNQADRQELDKLLPELSQAQISKVRVIGHTDNRPISEQSRELFNDNMTLSKERAKSVADYLQNKLGLSDDKVVAEGRGASEPVASNNTDKGRASNRRTEVYIESVQFAGTEISTMLRSTSEVSAVKLIGSKNANQVKPRVALPPSTRREIKDFDEAWLERAKPGVEWLMPSTDFIPEIPAVSVAIKHRPGDTITAKVNGEPLNPLFFFGMKQNKQGTVARSWWRGIHLQDGANELEFVVTSSNGKQHRFQRTVHFSGNPIRAELVQEYSYLVADGRLPPVLAVRFYDRDNHLVRPGVKGDFSVSSPYRSKQQLDDMKEDALAALDRFEPQYEIGEHGIALIELEPTSQSGRVRIGFEFDGERDYSLDAWLKPVGRDWIVVGMADAVGGDRSITGAGDSAKAFDFEEGGYSDGRVAFFAKGMLGEDWLLTASADSDKEESATGNGLFQTIDPDEYFQLYADNTEQRYETPSSEKLFAKLERESFYAMYGDYLTGLNETELSKYNRTVTGLKSEYDNGLFSFNGFATETSHHFVRDELRGDGTSGLYYLTQQNIVLNSETVTIETRDRFQSQDLLEQRTLRRHYDYNIDYQTGSIYFKQPVMSRDARFNPVYIVIEYETQTDIQDKPTLGGRGQLKLFDNNLELGVSAISDGTFSREGELAGLDAEYRVGINSRLRLEYATSELDDAGIIREGDAYLAEYHIQHDTLDGRIYFREQEAGFGLGQQAGSETGTLKYGIDGSLRLTKNWRLNSELFHQENQTTGGERDVAELDIEYSNDQYFVNTGLRSAQDVLTNGQANDSQLALVGAGTKLFDGKLKLRANSEVAIDSEDANPNYPSRYVIGAEYEINKQFTAYIEEELTQSGRQDTHMTRAGLRARPWEMTSIDSAIEQHLGGEYGPRIFAVMGLTQRVRLNKEWSIDFAYDRAKTLEAANGGDTPFNINVPPASGSASDDFSAVSTGLSYRADTSAFVSRFEHRQSDREDKFGVLLGWQRSLKDGISYGLDSQVFDTEYSDGSIFNNGSIRFSLAYRPITSKWQHLNRIDFKSDKQVDVMGTINRTRKFINNWKGNYMPNRRQQFAFGYGVKYVLDNFDGTEYDGITHYLATEYRHDILHWWDVGAHIDSLYSANAQNKQYSFGLSTGFNLAKNTWFTVGYNYDGFNDSDFSLADYTAKGPYIKLRIKFDQNTLGLND